MAFLARTRLSASPPGSKDSGPLAQIERILRSENAERDLETLVNKWKCDLEIILLTLALIRDPLFRDTWEATLGIGPKKIRALARQMRKWATKLEVLSSGWDRFLVPGRFRQLADLLRDYATYLELVITRSGPKRHPMVNAGKCFLVAYVKTVTGRFLDREVSGLISAVLGLEVYDASRHAQWRREHSFGIQHLRLTQSQHLPEAIESEQPKG